MPQFATGPLPMFQFPEPPPTSLYVHIPWCVRKCPYCDFNSHEPQGTLPERQYVDALLADLEAELQHLPVDEIASVFIGGGTPSLFQPESIERLLLGVHARTPLAAGVEVTLEANPGTLEFQRFAEFRAAGVNRVSIGVQSFADAALEKLGRIHSGQEAIRAAEQAHDAGFDSFNLDLMFGLPGQTTAQALADLRTAMDLEPPHLSWYQLTIEPNTWFHHHPPAVPDDDACWDMQRAGQDALAAGGWRQYEVSAYARDGHRCRHNLNYWQFGDYLGIGAGAHGKRTDPHTGRIERRRKPRSPSGYLEAVARGEALSGRDLLTPADVVVETMLNGLRLNEGIAMSMLSRHSGLPLEWFRDGIEAGQQRGLLVADADRLIPTDTGRRFLNDLIGLFLPDPQTSQGRVR